ncbi:MAG: hypothetical protein ACM3WT_09550, partial [Bacillota bacterium]
RCVASMARSVITRLSLLEETISNQHLVSCGYLQGESNRLVEPLGGLSSDKKGVAQFTGATLWERRNRRKSLWGRVLGYDCWLMTCCGP